MSGDIILVIVVGAALAFDFTNGFHDTANVVAISISTRAIGPRQAEALASLLNFAGAFISLKVAATIGKGFVDTDAVTTTVVFAGLVGAIAWNVITWSYGLPSSSSHALIGGLVGSVVAAQGFSAVNGGGLVGNLIVPAIIAPVVAFAAAGSSILLIYRSHRPDRGHGDHARGAGAHVRAAPATAHPRTDHVMTGAAIDTAALLRMLYSSLLGSITVAVIFATTVLGAVRATDKRRANHNVAAAAYGVLAAVGVLLATGIIVYGLTLITRKS
jgi:phosphate/sulfate permease